MKKNYKIILIIALLFSLENTVFAFESKKVNESTFNYVSHEIYCFFVDCDSKKNINNKEKYDIFIKNNNETSLEERVEKKEDSKVILKKGVIENTKYIRGNTVVKNYYNTIEKTPIINNTYPTEIKENRVVEEYDDTVLSRKIKNNRRLISQLAGIDTSDDNLSDNSLNDLADTNIISPTNGQVLT